MKLTGDKNQCPTCNEFFKSTTAFEKHRTGEFGTATNPQARRRCLTVEEMTARGMLRNVWGFWVTQAWDADAQESISSLGKDA